MNANRNNISRRTRISTAANRAVFTMPEALESRRLMSAPAGAMLTAMPADLVQKVDARLYQVAQDVTHGRGNDFVRDGIVRLDKSDRMQTFVRTIGNPEILVATLRDLGAQVDLTDRNAHVIQAWIPCDKLDEAARLAGVADLDTPTYAITNTAVVSAGDSIHKADKVRQQFAAYGIDGTGLKIGVISDGAAHAGSVNDLGTEIPSVTVDPLRPGSGDEGTAMLEIVHDLAPGAQLYFSGVGGGVTSFGMAAGIDWLVAQGCNVIVDDVTFFDQSFFTDTTLAQHAQTAISNGVVYVTAAGNQAQDGHYQANFVASQSAFGGGILHRFAPGGVDFDAVNIPAHQNFRAFLQWSDAWGASNNNYDLYLFDGNSFAQLASSVKVQDGNDNPFEAISYTNNSNSAVNAQIWIVRKNGAANREIELFTVGNSSMAFDTPGDALIGQAAVEGVISVAAARATTPDTVEFFSSRGGSTVYDNFVFQTKHTRETLDGTAIDGVQTRAGQKGFFQANPFFGTSAAAPHAAAIAALVRQANPSLTPAQVAGIMANTAVDLAAPGYDTDSGAGRYDALAAVYAAFIPDAPTLDVGSDTGVSNSDRVTKDNSPTFTGQAPAGSFVRLYVNGMQSTNVQLGAGVTSYSLTVPGILIDGNYNITIRVAPSALGVNSNPSAATSVTIDTQAPSVTNTTYTFDAPGQRLTFSFSEDIADLAQVANLALQSLTTNQAVPGANIAVSTLGPSNAVYTFPGYTFGALPDGDYHAGLTGLPLSDLAGNPVNVGAGFDFAVFAGDTNHDRTVDFNDLVALSQHYGQSSGQPWAFGDFTADGVVDFNDMVILSQHYNTTLPDPAVMNVSQSQALVTSSLAGEQQKKTVAPLTALFNTNTRITHPGNPSRPISRRK
jgi:subtilisin family serine protease